MKLKNKVALVTGSSRGIGAIIAEKFAENGAFVIVNYVNSEDNAKKVVEGIKEKNGEAISIRADISNLEEVEKMVSEIINLKGKIDILVNNATNKLKLTPFSNLTWEEFENEINVSIKGSFNCSKEISKKMVENKEGVIINIISSACSGTPPASFGSYVTAKMGLMGLSKSMAVDLSKFNIRVNMISPGLVDTDLTSFIPSFI